MLTIMTGTISGDDRSGPRSSSARWCSSKVSLPPLPVAITVPARYPSPSISSSASSRARRAAATAIWLERSMRRAERRSMKSPGSKPRASQAMRQASSDASKRVIGPAPERPASAALQVSSQPMPSGPTMPSPVTTTRRAGSRPFALTAAAPRPPRAPRR